MPRGNRKRFIGQSRLDHPFNAGGSGHFEVERLETRWMLSARPIATPPAPHPSSSRHARAPKPIAGLVRTTDALDQARYYAVGTAIDQQVLVAGGSASPESYVSLYGGPLEDFNAPFNAHYYLETQKAQQPNIALSLDGQVLLSGEGDTGFNSDISILDVASGTWTDHLTSSGPPQAGVAVGDRAIFTCNPDPYGQSTTATAEVFDAPTKTWFTMTLPALFTGSGEVATSVCGKGILPTAIPFRSTMRRRGSGARTNFRRD